MKKEPAPGFMQATTCVFEMDLTCAGPTHVGALVIMTTASRRCGLVETPSPRPRRRRGARSLSLCHAATMAPTRPETAQIWTRDHPSPSLMKTTRVDGVRFTFHAESARDSARASSCRRCARTPSAGAATRWPTASCTCRPPASSGRPRNRPSGRCPEDLRGNDAITTRPRLAHETRRLSHGPVDVPPTPSSQSSSSFSAPSH